MTVILWSLAAAVVAIGAEYLYRTLTHPWWCYLWLWIPMQLFIGYAIYRLVTVPGVPLIGAFVTWSVCTLAIRVGVSIFVLHDRIAPGTWIAVGLLVLAKIAQQVWK